MTVHVNTIHKYMCKRQCTYSTFTLLEDWFLSLGTLNLVFAFLSAQNLFLSLYIYI